MSKRKGKRGRGGPSPTEVAYAEHPEWFEGAEDNKSETYRMTQREENRLKSSFNGDSVRAQLPKQTMQVEGRTPNQIAFMEAARNNEITFCLAPAGTGKTFIAAYLAIEALKNNEVDEVIITRPAVGGQETNGYLPGGIDEKLGPHMAPVIGHLEEILGNGDKHVGRPILEKLRKNKVINILPFEYMRGTDLKHAFVVGDELQNATHEQTKMLLTRISEASKFVLVGDPEQTDLNPVELSGFKHAAETIGAKEIEGIGFVKMGDEDVIRHHLIGPMLEALRENPPVIPEERHGKTMPTPAQSVSQHKIK